MAIVSCPACSKKLKVADTSIGKKVKCSCGNIFVAEAGESAVAPAVAPTPVGAPEKVLVACTDCGAKLKVGTASLGKKMKCPKCAGVFIASLGEQAVVPPAPPTPAPPVVAAPAKDEEDDLFTFAQSESTPAATNGALGEFQEDEPAPTAKARKPALDDDEDMPRPKGKLKKPLSDDDDDRPKPKPKKPVRDEESEEAPKYPSRLLVNLLVFALLFFYLAAFAVIVLELIDRATLVSIGWPAPAKTPPRKLPPPKQGEDPAPRETRFEIRAKDEKLLLEEIRKLGNKAPEKILAVLPVEDAAGIDAIAFSPTDHKLATAARKSAKDGIILWDLKTLKPAKTIPLEAEGVKLQYTMDGQVLASASAQPATFKLWNAIDGTEIKSIDLKDQVQDFTFTGERLIVLTNKRTEVKLFKIGSWEPEAVAFKKDDKSKFLIVPNTNKVVEVNEDKRVVVHDLAGGAAKELKTDLPIPADAAVVSTGTKEIAFIVDDAKAKSSTITIFDMEKAKSEPMKGFMGKLVIGEFSPDGKLIDCTFMEPRGSTSLVYEVATKEQIAPFPGVSRVYVSVGGVFMARAEKNAVHLMAVSDYRPGAPKEKETK
jgi:hypothetical protein